MVDWDLELPATPKTPYMLRISFSRKEYQKVPVSCHDLLGKSPACPESRQAGSNSPVDTVHTGGDPPYDS